jgi:hypothetical protein
MRPEYQTSERVCLSQRPNHGGSAEMNFHAATQPDQRNPLELGQSTQVRRYILLFKADFRRNLFGSRPFHVTNLGSLYYLLSRSVY